MSRFINSRYAGLEAYTPGEQPKDMKYIKLNTNESPFPPSVGVLKAVEENADKLNLYPDPDCAELKRELAKLYGVEKENIYVSNGSDDILNFFFLGFCDGGAVFPDITYGFYKVYAELYGVDYKKSPLRKDFTVAVEDYLDVGKNVVIANPNAPTGLTLGLDAIEEILKSNPDNMVLVDEAYVDFGGESCIPLTKKYKNLLVVATFSKSRSMAGARLGFAIADKEIISDLEKIKYSTNPYCINRLTLAAGVAAVRDNEYYMNNCKLVIKAREYTAEALGKLGFSVLDSKANFIFAESAEIGGRELYEKLKARGILVRYFGSDRINNFVRITVGTMEQMQALVAAVEAILKGE